MRLSPGENNKKAQIDLFGPFFSFVLKPFSPALCIHRSEIFEFVPFSPVFLRTDPKTLKNLKPFRKICICGLCDYNFGCLKSLLLDFGDKFQGD